MVTAGRTSWSCRGHRPIGLCSGGVKKASFRSARRSRLASRGTPTTRPWRTSTGSLAYLRGGRSGLTFAGDIAAGPLPENLAIEDFNGDGLPDIVVANEGTEFVTFLKSARRPFEVREISLESSPRDMVAGDFNDNGSSEIVLFDSGGVTYRPDASVSSSVPLYEGNPGPYLTADLDADGFLDLLVVLLTGGSAASFFFFSSLFLRLRRRSQ